MTQTIPQNSISPNASVRIAHSNGLCSPREILTAIVPSDEIDVFFRRYQTIMNTLYGMKSSASIEYTTFESNDGEHLAYYTTGLEDLIIVRSSVDIHSIYGLYFLDTCVLYTMDYSTYEQCNTVYRAMVYQDEHQDMLYDEVHLRDELYEFLSDYYRELID